MSVIRQKSTNRGGVSLLEILICIGILSVGLLGVVALIPVGHFALNETNKIDRSTACAKAAKAQVEIRDLLNPAEWRYYAGNWQDYDPATMPAIAGSTIVLDPLGVAYDKDAALNFPFFTPTPLLYRFTTLDLVSDPSGNPLTDPILIALSEQVCLWSDDTLMDIDDTTGDLRPRQVYTSDDPANSFGPYPSRTTDDTLLDGDLLLSRQSKGDFSWFATITPDLTEVFHPVYPVNQMRNFEVSVVVCYKRDFSMDTSVAVLPERAVYVDLGSFSEISGTGASDIPLALPDDESDIEEKLEVKPGQWIMLVGEQRISATQMRTISKWYRILSVDDELDDKTRSGTREDILFNHSGTTGPGQIRWVTVTGPEWRSGTLPGEIQNTQAVLVDGVIGVFTETMTLDR